MDHFHKMESIYDAENRSGNARLKPSLSSAKRGPFVELLADRPENNVGLAFLFTQCLSFSNSFESDVRQAGRFNEVHNSAGDLSHVSCFLEEHYLTK